MGKIFGKAKFCQWWLIKITGVSLKETPVQRILYCSIPHSDTRFKKNYPQSDT